MKKQVNAITNTMFSKRFSVLAIGGAVLLSACGDSGLEPIRQEALNDALNAQQSVLASEPAANVDTNITDTNTSIDSGDQTDTSVVVDTSPPVDIGAATSPDESQVSTPNGIDLSNFDLVFSDEFQGATLDSRKWNSSMQWGPDVVIYNQLQYYVDTQNDPDFGFNPFSFDGETMTITARQTPEELRASANEQSWLSGAITTAGNFDLTHGYIEARMDVQGGQGLWPAFWALSSDFDGLRPELFIMEHNGATPNNVYHNYNYQDSDGNLRSPGQWEVAVEGLETGFHTFGVLWSPEEFIFYVDGTPRYRITGENVANQDVYLILNLALGGIWAGATDGSTPESPRLVIDYVRAYQLRTQ